MIQDPIHALRKVGDVISRSSHVFPSYRFDKRRGLLDGPTGLVLVNFLTRVVRKQPDTLNLVERLAAAI